MDEEGNPENKPSPSIIIDLFTNTSNVEFVENLPDKSTLDKIMSLRKVTGAQDIQVSEKVNIVMSMNEVKSSFETVSPICGKCTVRLFFRLM